MENKMKNFNTRSLRLRTIKGHFVVLMLAAGLAMVFGCSQNEKVVAQPQQILIPPRIDLKAYNHIGVIEFSSNAEDNLKPYVTQNFIQSVQSAQPGVRVLELGGEKELLKSVNCNRIDFETIRSIGKKYNVDVVIFGHLQVSEIKPRIKISSMMNSVRAEGHIEASLNTKMWETESGATLWTHSSTGKESVANFRMLKKGLIKFGASDPKEKYGKLVPELVYYNTTDFRPHYEYR
jgi:hypothetical protein